MNSWFSRVNMVPHTFLEVVSSLRYSGWTWLILSPLNTSPIGVVVSPLFLKNMNRSLITTNESFELYLNTHWTFFLKHESVRDIHVPSLYTGSPSCLPAFACLSCYHFLLSHTMALHHLHWL